LFRRGFFALLTPPPPPSPPVSQIAEDEKTVITLKEQRDKLLGKIGNVVHASVPTSNDEAKDSEVTRMWGELRSGEDMKHHHELLWMIDGFEPERGVATAGHRGYFLKGVGTLLNVALVQYGLHFLTKRKYTALQPPFFMNKSVMAGVAQLEEFDEALYHVSGEGEDKYLIATSEQPICAYHQGEWLDPRTLPLMYAGSSTCFRKEAGAHGRDTWGIFRVHQFEKIEQFAITDPASSWEMHEQMIKTACEFYEALGLPYRVINIVSGELNNAAAKKYDLEGWFPAFAEYRELVSASNCTDYQSRAMEIRCECLLACCCGLAAVLCCALRALVANDDYYP
jgi:seryl-tRNA synthetase